MEVVKAFALVGDQYRDKLAPRLTVAALSDPSDGVVQYAIMLVAETQQVDLLPRVVESLKSSERSVRMSAAQAVGRFGKRSAAYLSVLEDAAAAEPDEVTRQTMTAAARAIRSAKQ
jgi:HEAT repeat protein